eukprot:GHVL01016769.1.p1 GENE.GHVL01016769.1~~GHVL01016769.1.p1  ORF type:complete len:285 (+),score=49.93 GHVL01016769.1:45-899(+)
MSERRHEIYSSERKRSYSRDRKRKRNSRSRERRDTRRDDKRDDRRDDKRDDRRDDKRDDRRDDRRDDKRDDRQDDRSDDKRDDRQDDRRDDKRDDRQDDRRHSRRKAKSSSDGFSNSTDAAYMLFQEHQRLLALQSTTSSKKQRELYVGNLAQGIVVEQTLIDFFTGLFHALPSYHQRYASMGPPVLSAQLSADRKYSFVEFRDEVLAGTAINFNKTELCGRALNIGRPSGHIPGVAEPTPLDIAPLISVKYICNVHIIYILMYIYIHVNNWPIRQGLGIFIYM